MAFENIGIGGILSFDSRAAVANMGLASRAFQTLGRTAQSVQAGVSKVGQGLGQALGGLGTLGTGAIVGVGFGIKKWVGDGIAFNKEMEGAQLAIATILATVKKTPLEDELKAVPETMAQLNRVAAQAPGELTDIVGIFQQMAGPMTVGQASMEEMLSATKGTAILAGVLKRSFNDTGAAMSKLAAGQFEAGNDILMMLKNMGLMKETTQEWKALLPEQRVKRIGEMLATFAESGKKVEQSWDAQSSTLSSISRMMAGSFTKKMFENMKSGVGNINDAFFKDSKKWTAAFEHAGETFGRVITFITGTVKDFVVDTVRGIQKIQDKFDHLGMSIDTGVLKRVAEVGTKIAVAAVALSPVITIVGFIGSKIAAVATIAQGLLAIVSSIGLAFAPVIAIAGALFLLFRRDGESVTDTLKRGLEYVTDLGRRFYASIEDAIHMFRGSFAALTVSLQKFWAGIQPGLASLRSAIGGIIELISQVVASIIHVGSMVFNAMTRAFEAMRPGMEKIFNAVMGMLDAVIGAANYMFPKIMAVLEPIFNVMLDIGVALAAVFGKLMELLDPIIRALTWLFKEILVPLVGFVTDTLGPVFTKVFKAIGFLIEGALGLIGKLVDGVSWAVDKLEGAADSIGDAASAVGGAVSDAWDFVFGDDAEKGTLTIEEMWKQAELAAKSYYQLVTDLAGMTKQLYEDTLKPLVDQGAQIVQMFEGIATIETKNPDVNVAVEVKNKATMCVNGRQLSVAQSEYSTEVSERAGFNKAPWQTQRVQIAGVKPS